MISPASPAQDGSHSSADAPRSADAPSKCEKSHPWDPVMKDLGALQSYAQHYLQTRADAVKHKLRQMAIWAVLGLVAAVAGVAALATAVVLLLQGMVDGLSVLLGDRPWAGELIVGGVILGGLGAGLLALRGRMNRKSYERTKENYARRREEERVAHQHDVVQRAARGQRFGS